MERWLTLWIFSKESASSDSVPIEYEMDEIDPVDMELDNEELEPIKEDPVPEAESEDMVLEEEAAEAEPEMDSSGSEEEMPAVLYPRSLLIPTQTGHRRS
ncbi:hypothetical protein NL676_035628 [Syzygium grande]|nr:hypothetical protein NL676_035628 [Syzygium grande]